MQKMAETGDPSNSAQILSTAGLDARAAPSEVARSGAVLAFVWSSAECSQQQARGHRPANLQGPPVVTEAGACFLFRG